MGLPFLQFLFPLFLLFSLLQQPSNAIKKSYIVYLGSHSHGPNPTAKDFESATANHYRLLGSALGSNEKANEAIFYSYNRYINGFAALLEEEDAANIANNPNVISVFPSKGRKLHTTRSWNFLGLENDRGIPMNSIWRKARFGEDVIIGNLDTGVWPESKSFRDEGMKPVPSRWRGVCEIDNLNGSNRTFCNKKLIGARYFNKGYEAYVGQLDASFQTARDHDGHGSHTLSTAGGNFVRKASVNGHGAGTAKGGSPKAHVAAYKVCWPPIDGFDCFDADIIAGFEAAISDGVDVLSVSLGGDFVEYFEDGLSIASFHAVQKGIVVVTSAGNAGPDPSSVNNVAPWMITVGASTIDREFTTYVALGDKKLLKGTSLSATGLPRKKFYPLISGTNAKLDNASLSSARLCQVGSLDPEKVKGKILLCLRGENGRVNKGALAAHAGAIGMILANDEAFGNELIADPHVLTAAHINFTDGQYIYEYINRTKEPIAYITSVKTHSGTRPAPVMAAFSSRGPNFLEPALLKPDITAPGVSIIAAFSEPTLSAAIAPEAQILPFNSESGTSMSCPHVSGVVGLLKTLHPDWSPAAIRSAIMTTARTRSNAGKPIMDSSKFKATPFAYGAGHIRPNSAAHPGLIYDLNNVDYLKFLCGHGYNMSQIKMFYKQPFTCKKSYNLEDFNYPSISVPNLLEDSVNITRTVTNVGPASTYRVRVRAPAGVSVSVEPSVLSFSKAGEKKTFKVSLKPKVSGKPVDNVFGQLLWSDGKHYVRSPIVVKHK